MRLLQLAAAAITCGVGPVQAQASDEPLVIKGLDFVGNKAIDDFTLGVSIATSNSSFFARTIPFSLLPLGRKRYLDERELRRDVVRVILLYRQSGYPDVTVDTLIERGKRDVHVKFLITEGKPLLVSSVQVTGVDGYVPAGRIRNNLPLRKGEPFNRFLMQASQDSLTKWLRNAGFPFAEVFKNYSISEGKADVVLEADRGPLARIGQVSVDGTQQVSESVVRNILAFREGDLFSARSLLESQRNLYRSNMFDFASVELQDSLDSTELDSLVDIRVRLTEGSFKRVRLGFGYGTIDCFRTLTTATVNNFKGGGRTFDVGLRLSKIGAGNGGLENSICDALSNEPEERLKLNYNATVALTQPFVFSRRARATVSFAAERRSEIDAFLVESFGPELSYTILTNPNDPLTLSYSFSSGRTDADAATFCTFLNVCRIEDTREFSARSLRSVLSLNYVRDRSNSTLNPSRGTVLSIQGRFASSAIGSDSLFQFLKGIAEFASYHPIGHRSVFAWRVRLGGILAPNVSLGGGNVRFISPDERFYAGGPSTVRGFNQNELGPVVLVLDTIRVDPTGVRPPDSTIITSPIGGNRLFLANAELRLPFPGLSDRVGLVLFADAGKIFESGERLGLGQGVRVTPGVGIRVGTPIGPLRLDLGYNPYDPETAPLFRTRNGDLELVTASFDRKAPSSLIDRLRLHFSVGQAF